RRRRRAACSGGTGCRVGAGRSGRGAGGLARATGGRPGPEILSDRRYRPGSVVHYRYGGFTDRAVLADDGCYRRVLVGPDGEVVEDRREAWFAPPSWAVPVLSDARSMPTASGPAGVLVGDRFVVRQAIRHASHGG